jgi:glutamate synthase (NADPH) small chain
MYGIPNMKLDKEQVVLRRLKVLEDEGVKFICNTEVGKDFPAENMLKEFDTVLPCTVMRSGIFNLTYFMLS